LVLLLRIRTGIRTAHGSGNSAGRQHEHLLLSGKQRSSSSSNSRARVGAGSAMRVLGLKLGRAHFLALRQGNVQRLAVQHLVRFVDGLVRFLGRVEANKPESARNALVVAHHLGGHHLAKLSKVLLQFHVVSRLVQVLHKHVRLGIAHLALLKLKQKTVTCCFCSLSLVFSPGA
jgi:hypothetical protein